LRRLAGKHAARVELRLEQLLEIARFGIAGLRRLDGRVPLLRDRPQAATRTTFDESSVFLKQFVQLLHGSSQHDSDRCIGLPKNLCNLFGWSIFHISQPNGFPLIFLQFSNGGL